VRASPSNKYTFSPFICALPISFQEQSFIRTKPVAHYVSPKDYLLPRNDGRESSFPNTNCHSKFSCVPLFCPLQNYHSHHMMSFSWLFGTILNCNRHEPMEHFARQVKLTTLVTHNFLALLCTKERHERCMFPSNGSDYFSHQSSWVLRYRHSATLQVGFVVRRYSKVLNIAAFCSLAGRRLWPS
jgi:hypothetical protein